jgi:hypothetical protein
MMNKITILTFITATLSVSSAFANTEVGILSQTECASDRQQLTATQLIEKKIREFNRTEGGSELLARDESGSLVMITSGVVTIEQDVSSSNFGKSREFAYTKALTNVQAKFIQLDETSAQARVATEEYSATPSKDDLTFTNENSSENVIVRLGDKVFKLAEAKLDNALREEGASEEEIRSTPRQKKIDTFRDLIKVTAARESFGKASGLIPVKTMEAVDCNGRAGVAMISVYSEKNKLFVDAILAGDPIKPNKDKAAKQTLQAQVDDEIDDGSIIYEWGIRKLHDTAGNPMLASYSQWAYVPQQGMAKANERSRRSALNQADAGAYTQLTLFLDSQARFKDDTSREQFAKAFIEVTETDRGEVKTTEEITEILEKNSKSFLVRAAIKLTGISDPMHWDLPYPHASAQSNIVGSVLYWSPRNEDAINTAKGNKAKRNTLKPLVDPTQAIEASKVNESKVKYDIDDF